MNRPRTSNPKGKTSRVCCPHCDAPKIDEGSGHGHTQAGLPWCGQYVLFECGLLMMFRWNNPEMWHPCEIMLEGLNRRNGTVFNEKGKRVVDIDDYELGEARPYEPEPEQHFYLIFTSSTTDTGTI